MYRTSGIICVAIHNTTVSCACGILHDRDLYKMRYSQFTTRHGRNIPRLLIVSITSSY